MIAYFFLVAGVIFLFLEAVIPGFGFFGLGGIASLTIGFYQLGGGGAESWYYLLYLYAALGILFFFVLWILPRHMSKNPLVLKQKQSLEENAAALPEEMESFLGKEGISLSELRPAGKVLIDKDRLDVVTSGEFIEQGRKVRVITVEGSRVVVEECGSGEA